MKVDIGALAAHLAATDLEMLELRGPDGVLRLVRHGTEIVQEEFAEPAADNVTVRAPGPGLFLARHPLHDATIVAEGQHVEAGAVLGFLRIGPLLQAVRTPAPGFIAAVLASDGALAGYNDPLFEIEPDGSDA